MKRLPFGNEPERITISGTIVPPGTIFTRGISYQEPVKAGDKEIPLTLVRYGTHTGTSTFLFYARLPRELEGHLFELVEIPSYSPLSTIPEHQTLSVAPANNKETARQFYFHKDTRTETEIVASQIPRRGMSRDLQKKLPHILPGVMEGKETRYITRYIGVSEDWVRRVQSRYQELLKNRNLKNAS